eukprot:5586460-Heterocapsa_arctica.AAC.1
MQGADCCGPSALAGAACEAADVAGKGGTTGGPEPQYLVLAGGLVPLLLSVATLASAPRPGWELSCSPTASSSPPLISHGCAALPGWAEAWGLTAAHAAAVAAREPAAEHAGTQSSALIVAQAA